MSNDIARNYGCARGLKELCKNKLLVQSANKYDQALRLLHAEFGTGTAKRASTETVVDQDGKEVQVLNKRKVMPSAKTMYIRVEKKMKAVSQKKYQTHYGSKSHSAHVYYLMKNLIQENCIESKIIESDPRLALDMAKAIFQSFHDHWQVMERPGYDTDIFRDAVDCFSDILKAALPVHNYPPRRRWRISSISLNPSKPVFEDTPCTNESKVTLLSIIPRAMVLVKDSSDGSTARH